jgi:hypothetical protein
MYSWLEYEDWKNALRLLGYQFGRKNDAKYPNKHFETLSFFIYENSTDTFPYNLASEEYFNEYVKTGKLLANEHQAYSLLYAGKKGIFKYRNTIYLSPLLRLMYYAVGLHLARTKIKNKKKPHITTFYGGHLRRIQRNSENIMSGVKSEEME